MKYRGTRRRKGGDIQNPKRMVSRTGPIRCPSTIDSSMPIGRLEVINTEGLVIEPPLSCKEDKTGRGTTDERLCRW